jgi:hypothetical protein
MGTSPKSLTDTPGLGITPASTEGTSRREELLTLTHPTALCSYFIPAL